MGKIIIESDSPKITALVASRFASRISREKSGSAKIITLKGNLGSGKTTFVLGFLNHFGIKPHAASPTFVIMKHYKSGRGPANIYHLDAYRLKSKKDLEVLGFEEISRDPKNIVLVEWPEMVKGMRFKNYFPIKFFYGKKENERIIVFG